MDQQSPNPPLKRELGLPEVTLSGVGIILGAGVYVLIGQAAGLAGNAIWLAFCLSAIIALLTGLSYAELSSMFPKAGAEYDYVTNAFNSRLAFVIGWLVFLSGVLAAATVALGFAGYFTALTSIPMLISAIVLLIVLTVLLAYGVKATARVAGIATLIEVSGLVIIIAIGLPHLGSVNYWEMPQGYSGLFAASALIFFAYQGFESMVKFSEETKKPETTVPKALILALAISVILYVLVALSVVSVPGVAAAGGFKCPVCRCRGRHPWPGCCGNHSNCRPFCHCEYRADVHVCLVPDSLRYGRIVFLNGRTCVGSPGPANPVDSHYYLRSPVWYAHICR